MSESETLHVNLEPEFMEILDDFQMINSYKTRTEAVRQMLLWVSRNHRDFVSSEKYTKKRRRQ